MAATNRRLMLSIPKDIESDTHEVKELLFYDKSYSEMYRQLIRRGLDSLKGEGMIEKNSRQIPSGNKKLI